MLYGYIIFVILPRKCTIPIISFLNKIFFHFGSSALVGGLFDFDSDELVFQIVLVILVFAVGQLAVGQVAQCVVGVFDAVVFFEAVAADKIGVGR